MFAADWFIGSVASRVRPDYEAPGSSYVSHGLLQHRGETYGVDRASAKIALIGLAAERSQEIELCLGFNPLRDHDHAQALGQVDDRLDDRRIVQIVRQVLDEAAVDLEFVDREALQIIQAGIAGAEIVDRQADAHLVQLIQQLRGFLRVLHDCVLGEFDLELLRLDAVAGEGGRYALDQARAAELERGKIDGDRHDVELPALPFGDLAAGFVQHPFADQVDDVRFFGKRNETVRIQQSVVDVIPAHQRFGADQAVGRGVELRLVVQ